ncbi:MAG: protein kinase [Isosphaeraceae bacterium]
MTEPGATAPSSGREERLVVESLCDEFEDGWPADPDWKSRIERFVARVGEDQRPGLVEELVAIECELSAALGRPADRGSYHKRFPRWRDAVDRAFDWWAGTGEAAGPAHPARPERLGDYRIVREIGRGGMGVVYEAVQESLDRRVAIKTLAPHWANHPEFTRRFRREARAAGSLHHTNIVEVHGAGEQNGLCYYAMQLVEGRPLSQLIRDQAEPATDAGGKPPMRSDRSTSVANVGAQVARALEYAHRRGVLHRDVKPSNLLVDQTGTVWVTDFGLAKVIQEGGDATRTGEMIGSLRYLPPEALDGHWDERGDVYSLGLTLYEMLTLRPAYAATDRSVLVYQILQGEPVRPRRVDPSISRDLETVVLKAMGREPADRYPTAGALADDLQRLLDGKPIAARKASVFPHLGKWARRNKTAAALILLVNLVAFVGFPTLALLWRRSVAARELARRHEASAKAARKDAEAVGYASAIQLAQKYVVESNPIEAKLLLGRWDPPSPRGRGDDAAADGHDVRDWEWNFLRGRLDQSARVLLGHTGRVHFVAVRPDDAQIATVAGFDPDRGRGGGGEVILWDTATWRPRHVLHARPPRVLGAAYSPDGRWLATIAMKELRVENEECPPLGSISIWDTRTGALLKEIPQDGDIPQGLAFSTFKPVLPGVRFSPDGRRLISWPEPVEVWDTGTWQRLWKAPGWTAVFLPGDDRLLIVSEARGDVHDLATGAKVAAPVPKGLESQSFDFAESADRSLLSAMVNGDRLRVWDLPTSTEYRDVPAPDVSWGAVCPDGDQVVLGDRRGVLRFEPLGKSDPDKRLGHLGTINHGAFTHDGKRLITASADGTARVWTLADSRRPVVVETGKPYDSIADVAFGRDGRRIHYACTLADLLGESRASGWRDPDGTTHERRLPTTNHTFWPRSDVAYSRGAQFLAAPAVEPTRPDQREIVGYARSGKVNVWWAETSALRWTLDVGPGVITSLAWGYDGARLAVASHDQGRSVVHLFDLANTRGDDSDAPRPPAARLAVDQNEVGALSFDPAGRELAAVTPGGLFLWDLPTPTNSSSPDWASVRERRRHFPGKEKAVFLDYSPEGGRLAAAYFEAGVVRVHDTATGAVVHEIPGPEGVCCARFSPNGRRLALVGYDSRIYLCDARSGHRLLTLDGGKSQVGTVGFTARVLFSPDGRRIATNDWQGRITIWQAD